MSKFIEITDRGNVWRIPLEVIADNRAKYYAERDSDTTYEEEFKYVMGDGFEGLDWYQNNMDFEDIADKAKQVAVPQPLKFPDPSEDTYSCDIVDD